MGKKLERLCIEISDLLQGLYFMREISDLLNRDLTTFLKLFDEEDHSLLKRNLYRSRVHFTSSTLSASLLFSGNLISNRYKAIIRNFIKKKFKIKQNDKGILYVIWMSRYMYCFLGLGEMISIFGNREEAEKQFDKWKTLGYERYLLDLNANYLSKFIDWCNAHRIKQEEDFPEGHILEQL